MSAGSIAARKQEGSATVVTTGIRTRRTSAKTGARGTLPQHGSGQCSHPSGQHDSSAGSSSSEHFPYIAVSCLEQEPSSPGAPSESFGQDPRDCGASQGSAGA